MRELTDRTIVVCGGGGGIGAATAIRLGSEGARIVVGDVNAASKAAINTFTRHIASKWGKAGIRGNAVSPGTVLTRTQISSVPPEERAEKLARTRSTRLGQPSDIAATVAFLFSADAEWINGQVWTVDGGALMRQ